MVELLKDCLAAFRTYRADLLNLMSLLVPAAFVVDWSSAALLAPMVSGQAGVLLVLLANLISFVGAGVVAVVLSTAYKTYGGPGA